MLKVRSTNSGVVMKWLVAVAACAAILAASAAPSAAADLRVVPGAKKRVVHVKTWRYSNWRDRCAWANHYCLYAWDGYVYHYPWHDPPVGFARHARRGGN